MNHIKTNQHSILEVHTTMAAIVPNDLINTLGNPSNATTSKNSLVNLQAATIKSKQLIIAELTTTIAKLQYTTIPPHIQSSSPSHCLQNIHDCSTLGQLINFCHGCLFFPPNQAGSMQSLQDSSKGGQTHSCSSQQNIQVTSEAAKENLNQHQ